MFIGKQEYRTLRGSMFNGKQEYRTLRAITVGSSSSKFPGIERKLAVRQYCKYLQGIPFVVEGSRVRREWGELPLA